MAAYSGEIVLFWAALCFVFISNIRAATYSIPLNAIGDCQESQYFDLAELKCKDCGDLQRQTENGLSCECAAGNKLIENRGAPSSIACQPCPAGAAATQDGWNCIRCTTGLSPTNECAACEDGAIGVEYLIDGKLQTQKSCQNCKATTQPDEAGTRCTRCDESVISLAGTCVCNSPRVQTGGLCFPANSLSEATYNVPFNSLPDEQTSLTSWFFVQNLRAAEYMCRVYQNLTSCQLLGNMCVMLDYSQEFQAETSACFHYLALQTQQGDFGEISGWPNSMPWLYYDPEEDTEDIVRETKITTKFSAKPSSENSKLKMFVGTYAANGTYLGLQPTTGGTVQLCKDTVKKMDAAYTFATTYTSSCDINVQDFWNNYETLFYDMYIQFGDNVEAQELYAIPVLLDSYKEDQNYVNRRARVRDWQLTRRFFLVDNLSGKETIDTPAKVVRYASSIELEISIQQEAGEAREGKIYPPLLKVKYGEVNYDEDYESNPTRKVTFAVTYFMRRGGSNKNISITIGVLSAVALLYAMVKSNAWRRRAGLIYIDISTMLKFILFAFGLLADVLFVSTLGTCLYWLLFFKRQDQVYLVLPTRGQEEKFTIYVSVAFVFKLFDLAHLLFSQITADIFLIDWERSRGRVVQSSDPSNTSKGTMAPISIWRTYFIANEWNEIQETRRINSVFQIFAVLFFLEVIGLKHLTTTDPRSDVSPSPDDYTGDQSRVLRFAVASGMYIIIGLVQWLFFTLIYERFVEDALQNFVDLCSMANVSVFVLANNNYGFYIHGRSVHGFADTDMKEMRTQMKREEDNLCGQRGLLPNSDQQTFEMLLPTKFREQYNKIYQPLQGAVARIEGQRGRPTAGGDQGNERLNQAYATMNKFLCTFIDHGMRDIDYMVKDKLLFEQILDMEFYDPAEKGFFFNDGGHAFNKVLFHGQEVTLLTFEMLLFCIVDLIFTNYALAGIITYLAMQFLIKFRDAAGRNNLAKKTLVDERFLI
ncbi:meckelin-like [Amphiura filiformis]|uniref:meckelin-like n=1 Tax=Amphiura filiformis TaxID=82378 RepID=UPI003B21FE52